MQSPTKSWSQWPSLTTLFNTCIQCGQWPGNWKRGVWTPVFKKEDKADYTNYRPVTVLNAVAKVFESFLNKQIIEKIETHLYDKLSAYRKTHSCETNLILRRAKLPSLYYRRLQEIVILMYKVRNGLAPDYIGELFNFKNKVYSLRNADFDVPRYSTVRYGKHSIRYLGPYLWSRLSPSDRQQPSLDNFRRNIRKKDLASPFEGTCSNCALCTY